MLRILVKSQLSANRQWNRETDTFEHIPLTKTDLEQIQREYPKNPKKNKRKNTNKKSTTLRLLDKPSKTTTEVIEEPKTNYERLYELVLLDKSINTEGAYKDPLVIEILKEGEKELCTLFHLAGQPIPTPQSSNVQPQKQHQCIHIRITKQRGSDPGLRVRCQMMLFKKYKVIGQMVKDKMLSPCSVNGYSILKTLKSKNTS